VSIDELISLRYAGSTPVKTESVTSPWTYGKILDPKTPGEIVTMPCSKYLTLSAIAVPNKTTWLDGKTSFSPNPKKINPEPCSKMLPKLQTSNIVSAINLLLSSLKVTL